MIESRFAKKHALDEEGRSEIRVRLAEALSAHPEVVFAYVHGSFVKEREFRDIDVAAYAPGIQDPTSFESDASNDLSRRTGFPVEVRLIHGAPVAFQMAAIRDGLVLVSRSDEVRTEFIEKVGKRYREYAHFRNLFLQE